MAGFEELTEELDSRYCLGPKAGVLVQEAFALLGLPGSADALLEKFRAGGFSVEVASWLSGQDPVPLTGQEAGQMIGPAGIEKIAEKTGLSQSFVKSILGFAIPKIVMLARTGAALPEIPATDSVSTGRFDAVTLLPSAEPSQEDRKQAASEAGRANTAPQRAALLGPFTAHGSRAALAVAVLGLAFAAGWRGSGHWSALPQMAEDIKALKAGVETLRAGQIESQKNAAALQDVMARLDALQSEAAAAAASSTGKIEQVQRELDAKLSQAAARLDRIERQASLPATATPLSASPSSGDHGIQRSARNAVPQTKRPLEDAPGMNAMAGRADALGPAQIPAAPGFQRGLPQLITNWVVRGVYGGIALVESPHGTIEVAPGGIIPGAGRVLSIERRGRGWIVITSRGVVDSAPGYLPPLAPPRF
ncbi:MAG TPA: YidB family protein [Methylocella sp.]|nr:YidB family protein [Methylocella sp.]